MGKLTGRAVIALATIVALGTVIAHSGMASAQGNFDGTPPRRSFGTTPDMPPGGPGSFNPTGPSPSTPPGATAPMPPGGRGSFNPTGPLPGAPQDYVQPMPPGGRGSFNPTGPVPQPGREAIPGLPRQGVLSPRQQPLTTPSGKAPVAAGLEPCLKGWNPKRGLTEKQHRALCEKIWKR